MTNMITASEIKEELLRNAIPEKKVILSSFFKTDKGQYGEGDKFIGVMVNTQRDLVKSIKNIELSEIEILLADEYHECRMTALVLLVALYKKAKPEQKQAIFDLYCKSTKYINSWDLVDLSAPYIVGVHLENRSRELLYKWANSNLLWEQRISIVSTIIYIRKNDFKDALSIISILQNNKQDLIQKAAGWMLREIGKRNFDVEYNFLTENNRYKELPRTLLRYAIEKFPEDIRQNFIHGSI
ncbi:MAG: DNA alkylation repair protein [Bacteroidia bacterium]|nr:DNA alkylation repair protein [Bacteroidia bacterium]